MNRNKNSRYNSCWHSGMLRILFPMMFILIVLSSCNATKRVQDGDYLVNKVVLKSNKKLLVSNDELMGVVKQKRNRKIILFGRIHLHMYNIANPKKMAKSRKKKDDRIRKRNLRRIARGKKDTIGYRPTVAEWFQKVVGEAPIILDTTLAQESVNQISLYLMKKGYFDNTVNFHYKTWDRWPRKKKAKLYYDIEVKEVYRIDSISFDIKDRNIQHLINERLNESVLHSTDPFDVELLDKERDRITYDLKNEGYYYFAKEYIEFEVDSINKKNEVDIKMNIFNPNSISSEMEDNEDIKHSSYSIGEVLVNYQIKSIDGTRKDTLTYDQYTFVGSNLFPLNPQALARNIFIDGGDKYQEKNVRYTYQRLLAIEVISLVNIQFIEDQIDHEVLNVVINISFNKRGNIAVETTGTTNSGNNLGLKLSTLFKHKNIFHGAEVLTLQLQGGIESQNLITDDNAGQTPTNRFDLNTIEFGPKLSLSLPKLTFPFRFLTASKSSNQSTIITGAYNFQSRSDYKRSLVVASLGYTLLETSKTKLGVNLLEMNVIKINKSQAFIDRLNAINDRFLSDSYSDHFILASNIDLVKKKQRINKSKILSYNKVHLEWAGNLLKAFSPTLGLSQTEGGSFEILGIPFAQYIKISNDLRLYRNFNKKSSIAYRLFGGVGIPLENIEVLPFSRSFYGGGSNGIRGWKARSLGPGSYFEPVTNYDKIGDVHIETNIELRFDLVSYFEGALFIDAGNIWLYKKDSIRVGGQFDPSRFYKELAIGMGVGLRLNFDYFLVRFDLAMQTRDPSLPSGERWIFESKDIYNERITEYNDQHPGDPIMLSKYSPRLNLNLGIGYPF